MNIISTTLTRRAEERTAQALYHIDYTITDGTLERVLAAIYHPVATQDAGEAPAFVGNITFEGGQIFCSLPESAPVAEHMAAFEEYLAEVRRTLEAEDTAL